MADPKQVEQLKQSVESWNTWRRENPSIGPSLGGVDLRFANLNAVDLNFADLSHADLSGANLSSANLSHTDLSHADLSGANLSSADLRHADLSNAILTFANLSHTTLSNATLTLANLSHAILNDTCLHDASLSRARLNDASLKGANLSHADLNGASLTLANLSNVDLSHANLSGANLSGALLSDASLILANLSSAILNGAILNGTNLSRAILNSTSLNDANLGGANLSHASLSRASLGGIDLRTIKGLTEIKHTGPSHIDLHSIQLPQDGSAQHFLRGVGIPDPWIDLWRSAMMHPIQYHSLFISYSSKDEMLARRLHADFQDHGVRCWFAPEDMKIGDKIRSRIDEAIHLQDKLLLILSAASVTSDWVEHEVEMALAKERKEQRMMLFPIRVDRAILDQEDHGWSALVRHQRHIGDFTNWTDPQAYQQAFERLLRDLKKANEPQGRERKQ